MKRVPLGDFLGMLLKGEPARKKWAGALVLFLAGNLTRRNISTRIIILVQDYDENPWESDAKASFSKDPEGDLSLSLG